METHVHISKDIEQFYCEFAIKSRQEIYLYIFELLAIHLVLAEKLSNEPFSLEPNSILTGLRAFFMSWFNGWWVLWSNLLGPELAAEQAPWKAITQSPQ